MCTQNKSAVRDRDRVAGVGEMADPVAECFKEEKWCPLTCADANMNKHPLLHVHYTGRPHWHVLTKVHVEGRTR